MMRVEGSLISTDSAPSWLPVYTSKDVGYQLLPFLSAGTFNMQMRLGWVLARVSQIRSTFSTLSSFASRKRKGFANNSRCGTSQRNNAGSSFALDWGFQWILLFMHNLFGREILICLQKFVRPGYTPTRRRRREDEYEDAFWMCSNQQPKVAMRRI